jgi:hypothetical protein
MAVWGIVEGGGANNLDVFAEIGRAADVNVGQQTLSGVWKCGVVMLEVSRAVVGSTEKRKSWQHGVEA